MLSFALQSSWRLAGFFLIIYLLAVSALLLSMAPFWLKIPVVILVLSHAYFVFRRKIFLLAPQAIVHIRHEKEGLWQLKFKAGGYQQASLCGHSFVSRYAMVLSFTTQSPRKRLSVILTPSVMGEENFRQLFIYCGVRH